MFTLGHGGILTADGGDYEEVLARFAGAGIDVNALASQLQEAPSPSSARGVSA